MIKCHVHKKQQIEASCYISAEKLPVVWDEFLPEDHFLKSNNLKVTENGGLPDLSFCYVMVSLRGEPVLASGFQILRLGSDHINKQQVKPYQHALWQVYTSVARPKLLVGGHLFRHDVASVYYDANATEAYDAYSYYATAIDEALKNACASAVLIKDMPEELAEYFRNFAPQFMMLRNDISMEMPIPDNWGNMADYEEAIKHKYAQRYRKVRSALSGLEIRELDQEYVDQHKARIYDLYKQVTDHQQVRIGFLSPDFIPELKKHDNRLKVWGGFEDGELIAFFSAWVYEDAFDMFYIGFDYDKNMQYSLYFNILYFAIEQAILNKKPRLILGRTALDAKARLGCRPVYLNTFLYIRNSLVRNRVLQAQKNTSDKEGAWEARHPFKKE